MPKKSLSYSKLPRNNPSTVAEALLQLLMEAEVEGKISVSGQEHYAAQLNYRNGSCDRTPDIRLGSALNLRTPKVR